MTHTPSPQGTRAQAEMVIARLRQMGPPDAKLKDLLTMLTRDQLEAMFVDALVVCNNVTKVIAPLPQIDPHAPVPIVRAAPGAFDGPRYTLDRDRTPPPPVAKEKTCRDCHQTKLNDFDHFGKKWSGTRTNYVTVDVCKVCANGKIKKSVQLSKLKSFQHQKYDELIQLGRTHDEAIVECKHEANPLLEVLREKGLMKKNE